MGGYILSDAAVADRHATRRASDEVIVRLLDGEVARDPTPGKLRKNAHCFIVAQPTHADPELLLRAMPDRDLYQWAQDQIRNGPPGKMPQMARPGFADAHQTARRAHGIGLHHGHVSPDRRVHDPSACSSIESHLIDIEVREDGGLRVFSARASDDLRGHGQVMLVGGLAGLAYASLLALQEIAEASPYTGLWDLGLAVANAQGVPGHMRAVDPTRPTWPFSEPAYKTTTRASLQEITNTPAVVAERLLGRLCRALGEECPLPPGGL